MKQTTNILLFAATVLTASLMLSCQPKAYTEDDVFAKETELAELTKDGRLYHLQEFVDSFMTEDGNYMDDSTRYRTRSTIGNGIQMFSIDTLPADGPGIYIMGRVTTDDYGGNYYKALVIQEIVGGKQQNLRLSIDIGSAGGTYQIGQLLLIRCNGLAVGRYANQPQLCVPSYNNNTLAMHADEKVGWTPGRIPAEIFIRNTTLIGTPDVSKLVYEEMTMQQLYERYLKDYDDASLKAASQRHILFEKAREIDGLLVRVTDCHFTGQYSKYGVPDTCTTGDPELDQNANVFAPTTTNLNFPQGRFIADPSESIIDIVSTSEYAKYSHYYLPSDITVDSLGVKHFDYAAYSGFVEGILGYYFDKASDQEDATQYSSYKWAITPRDMGDIHFHDAQGNDWVPVEYSKN